MKGGLEASRSRRLVLMSCFSKGLAFNELSAVARLRSFKTFWFEQLSLEDKLASSRLVLGVHY